MHDAEQRELAKEAAAAMAEAQAELVKLMEPQSVVHATVAAGARLGIEHFGPERTAALLRLVADAIERRQSPLH